MTWKSESKATSYPRSSFTSLALGTRPERASARPSPANLNEIGEVPLRTFYGSPVPPEFMTLFVDRRTGNIEGQRFPLPLRRQILPSQPASEMVLDFRIFLKSTPECSLTA
jgi:hypothetical protein